jgi:hypothetical protein
MNVRLIIPNQYPFPVYKDQEPIDPVTRYGRRIANIAGGFTSTQGTGGWIAPDGSLVMEPVTIFDCNLPKDWDKTSNYLASNSFHCLAMDIARDLRQGSVCLSINGIMEYVKG